MDTFAPFLGRDSLSHSTAGPNSSFSSSDHPHGHGQHSMQLFAWIALQLAGQVTLPFLVMTMLFHKRISRRNPTIINLCVVWTLATVPPLLLFYAGKQSGPDPDTLLCLVQASTISAALPMASVAYLSVVLHACTVVNSIINASVVRPISLDPRIIFLMSSPYITFLTFALFVAILGAQNPQDVKRHHFFCEVEHHNLLIVVFLFTVSVVFLTLLAQVWISFMFYRNWAAKRKGQISSRGVSHMDLALLIRMTFFTIFEVVILVAGLVTVTHPHAGASKVLSATPPFAVFLTFASSPDILRAWFPCCFRKKPKRTIHDIRIVPSTNTSSEEEGTDEEYKHTQSLVEEPVVVALHPTRGYDLEMGAPPERTQTTAVVYPAPATSAEERDSHMHAIRALRATAGRI